MNQRPGLYIAYIENKGRGVFTSEDISEGEMIEIAPVIVIPKSELPVIHKTVLHDYYFLWGAFLDMCAIAGGLGSIYNHELFPNANFDLDIDNSTIDFYAIKDIPAGSEITINYHGEVGNDDALWF